MGWLSLSGVSILRGMGLMTDCTGKLTIRDLELICMEQAGHRGDHYDKYFQIRWPEGTKIGTCHLPPEEGVEVVQ